ncbi:hypothetical protein [Dyadobacter sandarakinus]|uniref:ZU5 domain-containing protein n=1 Tax=Dyadobacter sandarakinus TaxID=2747268 RepID=A0ABX7I738_9BACT|nr:hypothetical protein [Dyadobacter sandarakinus]QRR01372.1 hypothetical protein HWI92_10900 [Dyadobacter sandarakinus]
MKIKFTQMILSMVACAVLTACQPGESGLVPEPEPQHPTQGTPTEVGKPLGNPIQKTIGPAGGSITASDSSVTLMIPAGALKADTPISIQPIENKAWGGAGMGYELTPKNLELSKPAELVWNYKDADVTGSAPEALGIAFQQADHSWKGHGSITVDKIRKTVKAKVVEFVPVAFYESYFMDPVKSSVVPAEQLSLTIYFQEGHEDDIEDKIVLSPLTEPKRLKKEEVRNWRVNGLDLSNTVDPLLGGLSVSGNGAAAYYLAPNKIPAANEIAISVEVILKNTKAKLILISQVTIEGANHFSFSGAKVDSAEVGTIAVADGEFFQISLAERKITGDAQAMMVLSMLPFNGLGLYNVTDNGKVTIHAQASNRKSWSDSYYPRVGKKVIGPLSVTITEYNKAKKLVAGRIDGTMHYYDKETNKHETTQVSAKFKAASPY